MSEISSANPSPLTAGAQRIVYTGAELRLTHLDVELPDGDRIWWDTVHLLRTASVALLDADDRVLLLRRRRLIADRVGWELPGGVVEEDENPADAVTRELAELTGYRAGQLTLAQSFQPAPHSVDGERAIFLGRDPQRLDDAVPADQEQEWAPLDSILELVYNGQIWDAATLVALLGLQAHAW